MTAIGRQPHRHRHKRNDVAHGPLLAQGRGVPGAGVSVEQVGEPLVRLAHPRSATGSSDDLGAETRS